jgi:hypothetical protein
MKELVYFIVIWSSSWTFGIFCGHLIYFMVNWYNFPVLVCCTKKNLAALFRCQNVSSITRGGLGVGQHAKLTNDEKMNKRGPS